MKTDDLRVLQVINSMVVGGAEKLVLDISKSLANTSVSVDVLTLKDADSFLKHELENVKNLKLSYLTKGNIYNPFLIFRIIRYLKGYDVIHLHLFPTLYWVVLASFFIKKPRLIYTEHSTENRRRKIYLFKFIDRFIYKRLDVITCITDSTKKNLKLHIGHRSNLEVVNNGIFVNDYYKKFAEFNFFKNKFKLIQVSSFREQKDQMTLLRAMKILPEDISLILVGDGHLLEEHVQFCKENDLVDRVIFLGVRKDVPELLNYADVTVLSSHYEGFGLAILEGMAAGKPAVASDVEGVKEIVEGAGLLFERGSYKELATLILRLKNDEILYSKVSENCLNRAKDFDINLMINKFIEIYNR